MFIKKNILPLAFSLFLLGIATSCLAQQPFSEFSLGLRQGYQFSRINFDPAVPQGLNQGITSGIILQYLSQKQLGFQMEVNYSQRGWNAPAFGQPIEYRREMDFIEVPFLTHFAIGKKSFRIVINVGSYLSYLIDDRPNFIGGQVQEYYDDPINNRWSYGLTGGLGLALRSKIGVFQIEGRGALGLTDVFSVTETVFNASPEQFFGYQLSYLYRFGLKKKAEENIPEEIPINEEDPVSDI